MSDVDGEWLEEQDKADFDTFCRRLIPISFSPSPGRPDILSPLPSWHGNRLPIN
jgi:hypothetical protein